MNQNENGLPDSQKGFEEALQLLEAVREMATVMMELIRKPAVNYYNYGTIQNLVCGDYHAHAPISTDMKGGLRQKTFTDEQVSVALKACVGKGKVINNKKKWAGAYWCLRKKCYYPVDPKEFCDKIKSLKLGLPEDVSCDYESFRKYCNLSFMNYDFIDIDESKVDNREMDVFLWCREIARKLAEELEKAASQ